jgi:hypothetical protein
VDAARAGIEEEDVLVRQRERRRGGPPLGLLHAPGAVDADAAVGEEGLVGVAH